MRFRRILRVALLAFAVVALVVPWLPVQELTREKQEELPPQLARVILEEQTLPPPAPVEPPPPKPEPEPEVEPEPVEKVPEKPPEEPAPVDRLAQARDAAKVSGVLAFQDDLMAMRDSLDPDSLDQTQLSPRRGQRRRRGAGPDHHSQSRQRRYPDRPHSAAIPAGPPCPGGRQPGWRAASPARPGPLKTAPPRALADAAMNRSAG